MPNRLAQEKSPYLLQHAANPVDWFPWGPEAFDKAAREDKPIFLSIGYSTCHWCHVMEHESFENPDIAAILNRHFVSIKVDREERPDIDRIYMTFVQATTGSGGWPMSVFLTADRRPFFGGTYYPPDNRHGRPGFPALLTRLAEAWIADRARIESSGRDVIEHLRQTTATGPALTHSLDKSILDPCFYALRRSYDSADGGFGGAPKFPRPVVLNFLFRYAHATGNDEARDMALHTLRAMAAGGMHDHIGGGFHRYSVDERWFVSHFEKMLYDQAQLAISYLEAYQITRDSAFADVARRTLAYVLRDMTAPEGAFYSAEDADSPLPEDPARKGEGAFYLWKWDEVDDAVRRRFGFERNGNVHNDPHGEFTGKNILYIAQSGEPVPSATLAALLETRAQRPRPHRDDKILTAWNGLMISAFAHAAQILNEATYLDAARRAAGFFKERMWNGETLLRRYREGEAAIPAFLDDYAFLAQAFLDLYQADFDADHLVAATSLTERMLALFEDREAGAFFSTAEGDSELVLRMKDDYDGAEPAGNSVAVLNLLRLARLSGNRSDFTASAKGALQALSSRMTTQPVGVPQLLVALMIHQSPPVQIQFTGDPDSDLVRVARSRFLPNVAMSLVEGKQGPPTASICRDFVCGLPTTDPQTLGKELDSVAGPRR